MDVHVNGERALLRGELDCRVNGGRLRGVWSVGVDAGIDIDIGNGETETETETLMLLLGGEFVPAPDMRCFATNLLRKFLSTRVAVGFGRGESCCCCAMVLVLGTCIVLEAFDGRWLRFGLGNSRGWIGCLCVSASVGAGNGMVPWSVGR